MVRDSILSHSPPLPHRDLALSCLGGTHAQDEALMAQVEGLMARSIRQLSLPQGVPRETTQQHMRQHARSNLLRWRADPDERRHLHLLLGAPTEPVAVLLIWNHWALCSLFVAPRWQGQGLGRWLVNQAQARCAPCSDRPMLRLVASPGSDDFYRHLGFRQVRSLQKLPAGFVAMGKAWATQGIHDPEDVAGRAASRQEDA